MRHRSLLPVSSSLAQRLMVCAWPAPQASRLTPSTGSATASSPSLLSNRRARLENLSLTPRTMRRLDLSKVSRLGGHSFERTHRCVIPVASSSQPEGTDDESRDGVAVASNSLVRPRRPSTATGATADASVVPEQA